VDESIQRQLAALALFYIPQMTEGILELKYPHNSDQLSALHTLTVTAKSAVQELLAILGEDGDG